MHICDIKNVSPRLQGAVTQQKHQVRGLIRNHEQRTMTFAWIWKGNMKHHPSAAPLISHLSLPPFSFSHEVMLWQKNVTQRLVRAFDFIHWLTLWLIWRHLKLNPTSLIQSGAIDLFRNYLPKDMWRTQALLPSWSIRKHTYLFSEGYCKNKLINVQIFKDKAQNKKLPKPLILLLLILWEIWRKWELCAINIQ